MNSSNLSSWPEWVACVLVIATVLLGRRFQKALVVLVVVFAWGFGTAKGLMFPLAVGCIVWLWTNKKQGRLHKSGEVLIIGGALSTALLCWLFPLPVPPALAGSHAVGTFNFEIESSPKLLAQVWYPSDQLENADPEPWLPYSELAPAFPYHRLAYARAHSRRNVPAITTDKLLPVMFYEHSWMGHRAENVVQVEDLASRGFVVVAVDHPGQAERVRYADGSVVPGRYPEPIDLSTLKAEAAFEATAEQCFTERMAQVERVRLALKGNAAGNLRGRLNLDHAGVFGFSFGGSTALRICSVNPAFVAGANEDGLFLGTAMPRGAFLFFDQEMPAWLLKPAEPGEDVSQMLTRRAEEHVLEAMRQPECERVIIDGSRHLSFSDRIYASPFPRLARVGTRPAGEVHEILSARLAGFFRVSLDVR